MYSKSGKSIWSLFLFLLAGIVLGAFIGHYVGTYPGFTWLAFGDTFGLTSPLTLDLGVLSVTFGLTIKVNIASVLGIVLAVIAYKKI